MKLNTILLIDDDAENNLIHRLTIEDTGWTVKVHEVVSAKEALSYLQSSEIPDLIFLDINMPLLTGWDFIEEYKKLPVSGKENCTIIMLTSSVNYDDEEKARTISEISEFKNKPLTVEFLQELIGRYFAK